MGAPPSAWRGRGGRWAHLVHTCCCLEGREGTSPRGFEQEQSSRGTRMPLGRGCSAVAVLELCPGCGLGRGEL